MILNEILVFVMPPYPKHKNYISMYKIWISKHFFLIPVKLQFRIYAWNSRYDIYAKKTIKNEFLSFMHYWQHVNPESDNVTLLTRVCARSRCVME